MSSANLAKLRSFLEALKLARKAAADTALREGHDTAAEMDMEDEEEENAHSSWLLWVLGSGRW